MAHGGGGIGAGVDVIPARGLFLHQFEPDQLLMFDRAGAERRGEVGLTRDRVFFAAASLPLTIDGRVVGDDARTRRQARRHRTQITLIISGAQRGADGGGGGGAGRGGGRGGAGRGGRGGGGGQAGK